MKKIVLSLALPLAILLNSCSNCKDISLAELMHNSAGFAFTALANPDPTSLTVKIGGEFLNQAVKYAGSCACSESTESVEAQTGRFKIYDTDDNNDPQNLLNSDDKRTGKLDACQIANSDITQILQQGVTYLISFVLDSQFEVEERDEDNNGLEGLSSRARTAKEDFEMDKLKYGNNMKYQIVHYSTDGNLYNVNEDGSMTKIELQFQN